MPAGSVSGLRNGAPAIAGSERQRCPEDAESVVVGYALQPNWNPRSRYASMGRSEDRIAASVSSMSRNC